MIPLPHRALIAIAAVVDIALHARPEPVSAKALTARHGLPPRHFEGVLQILVRAGLLKGVRGPRGGYELARERRRISVADILRAVGFDEGEPEAEIRTSLLDRVVRPALAEAGAGFLRELDAVTVDDLCGRAGLAAGGPGDFTI